MDAKGEISHKYEETKLGYLNQKQEKFELVSCPIKKIFCVDILPEINELYSESEIARINKEYQRSVELLQKAYYKTQELCETSCAGCVDFFQTSINETLEMVQQELHDMSTGIFNRKGYQIVYEKLNLFLRNMNSFKIRESSVLSAKKVSG